MIPFLGRKGDEKDSLFQVAQWRSAIKLSMIRIKLVPSLGGAGGHKSSISNGDDFNSMKY